MIVHVQRSFAGGIDSYDLWFLLEDPIGNRRQVAHFAPEQSGPARLVWHDYKEGDIMDPTLRLTGYEVAMLKAGLDQHGPTTADGLALAQDAIKVRDRLLTMVEGMVARS